jgi:hypothetical protein
MVANAPDTAVKFIGLAASESEFDVRRRPEIGLERPAGNRAAGW